jgi:hypothetical protein
MIGNNTAPAAVPMSDLLSKCIDALPDSAIRHFSHSRMYAHSRRMRTFPESINDILPYGVEISIQSFILNWIPLNTPTSFAYIGNIRLLCNILQSVRYHVLPTIISAPPLWDAIYSSLKSLAEMLQKDLGYVTRNSSKFLIVFGDISDLMTTLFPLMAWDIRTLLFCIQKSIGYEKTLTLVLSGQSVCMYLRLKPPGLFEVPFDFSDTDAFFERLVPFIANDYYAEIRERLLDQKPLDDIRSRYTDINKRRTLASQRVADCLTFMAVSQRCGAPECMQTQASLCRRFRRCSGCYILHYCSEVCQRRAWIHRLAPHRIVCPKLKRMQKVGNAHHRPKNCMANFRSETTEMEYESAANDFATLSGLICKYDSGSFFSVFAYLFPLR